MRNHFAERVHFLRLMFIGSTVLAGLALLTALPALAQYPGQVKPQDQQSQVMRAIAVLEWTGDQDHPKSSRLVPVVLYDGEQLQDAGIFMARPAPLALSSEVEYELKYNGKTTGLFIVDGAGQVQGSWVGFGAWKPLPKPKPPAPVAKIDSNKDAWGNDADDKPVLHRKQHDSNQTSSGGDSSSNAPSADPDRPTLHKKTDSDSSGSSSSDPQDPDRPTLHKKTSDDSSDSGGSAPPDPDRPTLKKKTDQTGQTQQPAQTTQQLDLGHVESVKTVTDPDRPKLSRGKPADQGGTVLPTLNGMPSDPDLLQVVAVSDAKNRPEHLWSYSWANPGDEASMKAEMEDIARQALGLSPAAPTAPPEATKVKTASATHKKVITPPPPPAALLDEQFRVFELAYGSGATMVLSARTDGEGAHRKFVTLICQPNIYGKATVLYKNVTDAAHLDDSPRMRLVDAVDVMADNRGELLFELRGATQRQFALYRVLRGQVTRLFATGPASIGPETADSASDPHS
jgi:hypothetical protein